MSELKGKVVVITGASAGVGRATAREFARHGAKVALLARGAAGLEGARNDVEAAGGKAFVISLDVCDAAAVNAAADEAERHLGAIDVWINNAMATVFAPVQETTPEEFRRSTEVTYLGSVWGTMAALRCMRERNRGQIIQVGSALAHRSIPLQAAYCGAKHGLSGFLDSLRSELIHDGSAIKITAVNMPALNTPQFDWARNKMGVHPQAVPPLFQPELAAQAIVWAARHPRRSYDVAWPTVKAVWGQKFVPGLLDHYLANFGYKGQLTEKRLPAAYFDNLFEPRDAHIDHGARGEQPVEASETSPALWLNQRRSAVLMGLGGLSLLAVGLKLARGRGASKKGVPA